MLPAELSEGITSLNENEDRVALVIEYAVDKAGTATDGKAYRALVHNRAQLAYNSVGAWLEGKGSRQRRSGGAAQAPGHGRSAHGRWTFPARRA
jgi:exoribonuclease R